MKASIAWFIIAIRCKRLKHFVRSSQRSECKHGLSRRISNVNHALFAQEVDSTIMVRDIELYSLCEHHMLPFYDRYYIAYLPNEKVIGVSKLPRLVDMYARRLQIQERLTRQVAHAVMDILDAQRDGVVIETHHLFMMMRGVQKQNSMLTTFSMLGYFREHDATRNEFRSLVNRDRV